MNRVIEQMLGKTAEEKADDGKRNQNRKGAMENAAYGTVLLQEVDRLSYECQYLLYKAVWDKLFWRKMKKYGIGNKYEPKQNEMDCNKFAIHFSFCERKTDHTNK